MSPPKTPRSATASTPPAVSRADAVAGPAAAARPAGQAPDNGGDWMAEATRQPEVRPADGVPLDTRPRGDTHRGQATESKRGQR